MQYEEIEIDSWEHEGTSDYNNIDTIETIQYNNISYPSFFKDYMDKNIPCIIKNVSDAWNCTLKWIDNDKINFTYFMENYKDEIVPVAECNKITFNSQEKEDMKLETYMQYLSSKSQNKTLYLKDWHLRRTCQTDHFYEVPSLFGSDWLNEYAIDNNEDDYMFVYIGPRGSWTPLHVDVYSSYSWSVNVIGRKKWTIFQPGEETKLLDSLGNLPLLYDKPNNENVKYYEIIQDKGDAIFVPSGWHHQVENLTETISVNHNWINGCNIMFVWKALLASLKSVEEEISDLRETSEYNSQCQLILKSLFGMDFKSFVNFLIYIGKKRLSELDTNKIKFNQFYLGEKHILFDLKRLLEVITDIIHHPLFFVKCSSPTKNIETEMSFLQSSISAKLN